MLAQELQQLSVKVTTLRKDGIITGKEASLLLASMIILINHPEDLLGLIQEYQEHMEERVKSN